jgi:hypothetical protein
MVFQRTSVLCAAARGLPWLFSDAVGTEPDPSRHRKCLFSIWRADLRVGRVPEMGTIERPVPRTETPYSPLFTLLIIHPAMGMRL